MHIVTASDPLDVTQRLSRYRSSAMRRAVLLQFFTLRVDDDDYIAWALRLADYHRYYVEALSIVLGLAEGKLLVACMISAAAYHP